MGGRGSSSGGGGGGSRGLDNAISNLEKKEKTLSNSLARMVAENGSALGLPAKYYKTRNKLTETRNKLNDARDKRAKMKEAKKKEETNKTFVNSFGEATKRYITTSTYERAQRRMEKKVKRNMGWR